MDRSWYTDENINKYLQLIGNEYSNCLVLDAFFLKMIQNLKIRSSYLTLFYIIF